MIAIIGGAAWRRTPTSGVTRASEKESAVATCPPRAQYRDGAFDFAIVLPESDC
jgi:hypothetical protein